MRLLNTLMQLGTVAEGVSSNHWCPSEAATETDEGRKTPVKFLGKSGLHET